MKLFLKILKILLSSIFLIFIFGVLYFVFLAPKEDRFKMAGHMQGSLLSQKMFDIITSQHPDYSDAYFEQSVAFNKYGNHARGFELLNRAVDLDPKLHLGYRGYMKLRFLREFDGALSDFETLDELTPDVVDAPWGENVYFLQGECCYGKKDYNKAIEYFERTVAHEKEDWADIQTFVYLGLCEYELGKYDKAVLEFKRALSKTEQSCEAHFGLAKTYARLGKIELAKDHIKKAEMAITYKRNNEYYEYLNEIYLWEVLDFKETLEK